MGDPVNKFFPRDKKKCTPVALGYVWGTIAPHFGGLQGARASGLYVSGVLDTGEHECTGEITSLYHLVVIVVQGLSNDPTNKTNSVALKNGVFWDVTPCGSCKNRRFVGT
jgi:hypothetical protein